MDPPHRISRQNAVDYPVHLVERIVDSERFPEYLLQPFDRIILVVDAAVNEIYGNAIRRLLAGSHRQLETIVLKASEKQKDLTAFAELVSSFESLGVRRRKDLVVAAPSRTDGEMPANQHRVYIKELTFFRTPISH